MLFDFIFTRRCRPHASSAISFELLLGEAYGTKSKRIETVMQLNNQRILMRRWDILLPRVWQHTFDSALHLLTPSYLSLLSYLGFVLGFVLGLTLRKPALGYDACWNIPWQIARIIPQAVQTTYRNFKNEETEESCNSHGRRFGPLS
jgi:hypothetical protein